MENFVTEKYHIKNIDCVTCATKIENSLKELEGVDDATLNFANLTLHVKATNLNRVLEEIRRIDPGVELIPDNQRGRSAELDSPTIYSLSRAVDCIYRIFSCRVECPLRGLTHGSKGYVF